MNKDAQESSLSYLHKHDRQLIFCKVTGVVFKMYRLLPKHIPKCLRGIRIVGCFNDICYIAEYQQQGNRQFISFFLSRILCSMILSVKTDAWIFMC